MPIFEKGAWYWHESESESWIPVKLHSESGGKIMAKDTGDQQYEFLTTQEMPKCASSSLTPVENMVAMEELSEAAILHNLRMRFEKDDIYTYISSILVSVNPFKQISIYSPAIMAEYRSALSKAGGEKAPHVYALAHETYRALTSEGSNQSVIISGESGAGKTEATKLVLQYMAEMSGQGNEVEQQLLESNPIVEAFGNAKTVRNNNSSRFGKWIAVMFDDKFHIHGARITNYLLEKSRIVEPGKGERNYHAFYQLCQGASPEWKKEFFLDDVETYKITGVGECISVDGIDDSKEFQEALHAMDTLKFSEADKKDIWRTTAAVLHLGNIKFENGKGDKAFISNKDARDAAAVLLGTKPETLENSLVGQSKMMGKEKVLTILNADKATSNLQAMAKSIYGNMFDWLILRINNTLFKPIEKFFLVGVLDIFGFEIFEDNRFEQFCINFANEKMQQHFNEHIFAMEQNEYKTDHIDVANVAFIDNQPCLDVIEKARTGILAMTDEELKLPKGGDDNLLERMHAAHKGSKYYVAPKKREPQFVIVHYAGEVTYRIGLFCMKNKDELGSDAAECLSKSSHGFVSRLAPASSKSTVGKEFTNQLSSLMATLKATEPHFIRCIKSNPLKQPDFFDGDYTIRQLRYLGLKEVVNIRQLGYPIRRLHGEFTKRYNLLSANPTLKSVDPKEDSIKLLKELEVDPNNWRVGDTKVFVRTQVQKFLDQKRDDALSKMVQDLQAFARAKVVRSRFLRVTKAAEELQNVLSSVTEPEELDRAIEAYELLQMNTRPALLAQCVEKRNLMYKQRSALKSLTECMVEKDPETMKSAMDNASQSQLESTPAGKAMFDKCKILYDKVVKFRAFQTDAFAKRDLELVKQAVAMGDELGFAGALEQQARALVEKLAEEAQVKEALVQAMKSKDLETLKKTLQVAMNLKSGAMVGNAVQRAMALGLADDPMVKQALEMSKNLEQEVEMEAIGAELMAAIETRDKVTILQTINLAKEKGLGDLPQIADAEAMIVELEKEEALRAKLQQAVDNRDLPALEAAIIAAEAGGVGSSPECLSAKKTAEEIKRIKRELQAAKEQSEKAEKETREREEAERLERQAKETAAAEAAASAIRKAQLEAMDAERRIQEQQKVAEEARLKALEEHNEAAAAAAGAENQRLELEAAAARKAAGEAAEKAREEERLRVEAHAVQEVKLKAVRAQAHKEQELKLGEKIAAAAALGLKNDKDTEDAQKRQEVSEKQTSCIKAIENAIAAKDLDLLQSTLKRAKALDIPATNEVLRKGQQVMDELRDERELRDKELAEAEAAKEAEDLIPLEKPKPVIVDQQPGFDEKEYSQEKYRFTLFTGLRTPADFSEGRYLYKNTIKKSMFKHSKEPIPRALTNIDKENDNDAVGAFKAIMGYMGDRHQSFPEASVGEMITKMYKDKWLRNEVYVQVMKQLCQNKKIDCEIQGWRLMGILAEHVPPESNFMNFVMNFLWENFNQNPDETAKAYATYSIKAIEITFKKWQDKAFKLPVQVQTERITEFRFRTMDDADVTIDWPDGSETKLRVNPWEFNETLVHRVANMVGMTDHNGLMLYEYNQEVYRHIKSDICVLDILHQWAIDKQVEVRDQLLKKKGFVFMKPSTNSSLNRLVLNWGLVDTAAPPAEGQAQKYPLESTCPAKNSLMIAQNARSFVMGREDISQEEAVNFAARIKQLSKIVPLIGAPKVLKTDEEKGDIWNSIKMWDVPLHLRRKIRVDEFDKQVDAELAKLEVATSTKSSYLQLVLQRKTFGCQYFRVRSNPKKMEPDAQAAIGIMPPIIDLAVNHNGMFMVETASRKPLKNFNLLEIMGWSHKPNTVKIKVKKAGARKGVKTQFTLEFFTDDNVAQQTALRQNKGQEICALLLDLAIKMCASIEDAKKEAAAKKAK